MNQYNLKVTLNINSLIQVSCFRLVYDLSNCWWYKLTFSCLIHDYHFVVKEVCNLQYIIVLNICNLRGIKTLNDVSLCDQISDMLKISLVYTT